MKETRYSDGHHAKKLNTSYNTIDNVLPLRSFGVLRLRWGISSSSLIARGEHCLLIECICLDMISISNSISNTECIGESCIGRAKVSNAPPTLEKLPRENLLCLVQARQPHISHSGTRYNRERVSWSSRIALDLECELEPQVVATASIIERQQVKVLKTSSC